MTGADALLAQLADAGVEVMFGNPGSTELPLIDAFPRQQRIRYVLGLHEAAVMGMADGYAQQGDRLAVVNVHVQPGLANALSGILNAARARVPMLVTVGQQVTGLKDRAPFLGGELVRMAEPIAKAAAEVTSPAELPGAVDEAIDTALRHPRGPVVLSLPMDVLAAPAAGPSTQPGRLTVEPVEFDAPRVAALLGSANRPAVLAGDGVAHDRASAQLAALAERLGAPVYGEPFAARCPMPTAHPLWRGPLPGFAAEIRRRLDGHDVVLAVGMPVFRLFGHSPGPALPGGVRLIHIDPDGSEIGRNHTPEIGIVAPVGTALDTILDALADPPSMSALGRRVAMEACVADERAAAHAALAASTGESGVTPGALCRAVAAAVGPDDLVVDEALTAGRGLRAALVERNTPDNWLAHRGSALGWGLPAAVGAKMANPVRRVLCVHGDGSFMFALHALWTAARERLGVAVVVADNGGYEILRAGMEGLTDAATADWPGLALSDPPLDLVALARGMGATAERLSGSAGIGDAIRDVLDRAERGPAVLVVPMRFRAPRIGYTLLDANL